MQKATRREVLLEGIQARMHELIVNARLERNFKSEREM